MANEPQLWAQAIRDHINNPTSSQAHGQRLREWVLSHRMFEQWDLSHYQTAWLGKATEEGEMTMKANAPVEACESQPGVRTKSEFLCLLNRYSRLQ